MTAQYGPHRWSAGYHETGNNAQLRNAHFEVMDMRNARFVDCDLSGTRVVDGWLVDVALDGYVQQLVVNGIDVTDYVAEQLDRRHPERVQLRSMASPGDFVAMWDTIERLWSALLEDALPLGEQALNERVHEEWSFVETLRHLVYATDAWASRTVLDAPRPFHVLALPQTAYSPVDAAELGMDLGARPSLDEVLAARADRMAVVRRIVEGLDESELARLCTRSPAPGYPEEERSVADCLSVVMKEEIEHYRYASRDLAALS